MMPATKHFDPILGVDIHIIQPPGPVPPVPIPHPFIGIILDPFDYLPILGSTVNINFLPRGLAGTQGIATPPHIPIGGTFIKPPADECECLMGVMTINCDGDALSHMALPVLSCQCIGMPPIPRIRKKGSIKSLVLPTSIVLSIPAGPPVLIAGPPTISLMALGMRVGMGALGKAFKKFKATKLGKKLSSKVDNLKSKFKKKTPSANKGCGRPGEPVDVVSGANVDDFIDWRSPELPHFKWQRFYTSLLNETAGTMGCGFRHNWQHELTKTETGFTYLDPEGEQVEFPPLDPGTGLSSHDGWVLRLDAAGRYELSAALQPTIWFSRDDRRTMHPQQMHVAGQLVSFQLDDENRLALLTDETGEHLRLAYDRHGRLVSVSRGSGQNEQTLASYSYDDRARLTVWTDALDAEAHYEYDEHSRMTRKQDRGGYAYHYRYDDAGRCVHSWGDDGLYEIQLEYLPEELQTIVSWGDGARYQYHYDEQGVLSKIVDPTGGVTLFEVDESGNIVKQIEPSGDEVEYLYDQHGAHTRRVDASGQVLLPMHLQPQRPDGLACEFPEVPAGWILGGLATSRRMPSALLDQQIQRLFSTDCLEQAGDVAARQHVPAGDKLDVLGRIVEQTDAAGRKTSFSYDAAGNVLRKRDADGCVESTRYKSWNLIDELRRPDGGTIQYDYNLREAITRVVDAGGTATEYEYDPCDRLLAVRRGGRLRDRYAYTAGGSLCEKRSAGGELLLRMQPGPYDTFSKIELNDGSAFEFQHTDRARIAAVAGPDHLVQFEYDLYDRVRLDHRNGKGVAYSWQYPLTTVQTLLERFQTKYELTEEGVLAIEDPTGSTTTVAVDGLGRCLRTMEQGISELVVYDRRGLREKQVLTGTGGDSVRTYSYSPAGDLLRTTDSHRGSTEYSYDSVHRLVGRRRNGTEQVWSYDVAGNLLAGPGLVGVRLGSGNQLEATADESFSYNDRGHMDTRRRGDGKTWHYAYNALDQLVSVSTEDGFEWTASYDGLNRRTCKQWTDGYQSHQVEFYWEQHRLAAEIYDQQRLRIYIYPDRESFVPILMVEFDSPEADPETGRRYHLLSDQRGQIVEVLDASGESVWQAEAEPYGAVGDPANRDFQFNLRLAGQVADDEIGLYYNRHRYYDAALGRYIQSDPLGLAGGINTYAYPANPLVETDLDGLHTSQAANQAGKRGGANAAEGVPGARVKPSKLASMTDEAFESAGRIANKHGVRLRIRPSNPDCLDWIKKGHPKKPEFLKNKSINKTDTLMGPPPKPGDEGLVGHFKPPGKDEAVRRAEEQLGRKLTPDEAKALEKRRAQRLAEYNQNDGYLRHGAVDANGNKAHIDDERGVVVDNRPGDTQGKEFTGDHDVFDIQQKGPDGKWESADPQTKDAVVQDLMDDPHFQGQHPDHASWEYDPSDTQSKGIDEAIRDSHQPGGEPLVDVYPDGSTGTSFL